MRNETRIAAALARPRPVVYPDPKRRFEPDAVDSEVPEGILVLRGYLDAPTCRILVTYANALQATKLGVGMQPRHEHEQIRTDFDHARVTEHVSINGMAGEIIHIFNDIFCHRVAPFYDVLIARYERPQLLRYTVGGKYERHADADVIDAASGEWMRLLYRDYSVLLYLNEDFEGGALRFDAQDFVLRPEAGMLVAFPSDHRYVHEALPTTAGIRYALVSWASVVNSPQAKIPYDAAHIPLLR